MRYVALLLLSACAIPDRGDIADCMSECTEDFAPCVYAICPKAGCGQDVALQALTDCATQVQECYAECVRDE